METILKACNNGDIVNIISIDGVNQVCKVVDKRGIAAGYGVGVLDLSTQKVEWFNSLTDVQLLVPVR